MKDQFPLLTAAGLPVIYDDPCARCGSDPYVRARDVESWLAQAPVVYGRRDQEGYFADNAALKHEIDAAREAKHGMPVIRKHSITMTTADYDKLRAELAHEKELREALSLAGQVHRGEVARLSEELAEAKRELRNHQKGMGVKHLDALNQLKQLRKSFAKLTAQKLKAVELAETERSLREQATAERDALRASCEELAGALEIVKEKLVNNLDEPERSAFWAAVNALKRYRGDGKGK